VPADEVNQVTAKACVSHTRERGKLTDQNKMTQRRFLESTSTFPSVTAMKVSSRIECQQHITNSKNVKCMQLEVGENIRKQYRIVELKVDLIIHCGVLNFLLWMK
jgi:hypothetical protein